MVDTKLIVNKQSGGMFSVTDRQHFPGKIFWVDSTNSDASNAAGFGQNPDAPLATIAYAVSAAAGIVTANKGDVVFVMPGHTEAVVEAAGLAFDVAGIVVIGLGNGSLQPTITLTTATTADVDVDAANITLSGLRFVSGINDLAVLLDVNAGNLTLEDCTFSSSAALECFCFVDLATTFDDFTFRRCNFYQPSDPEGTDAAVSTGCIYFVDSERILFDDCLFCGNFESAIFHNKTTAAADVWIRNCRGRQDLNGAEVWTQVAGLTGGLSGGSLFVITNEAAVTEATSCGTASDAFFVNVDSAFGNDGGGGQLAVPMVGAVS